MSEPELRDAATVVVLRDTPPPGSHPGLQVLLVRRRSSSSFGPGAYVFPGGAVDRFDREPGTTSLAAAFDDREASRLLGIESGGLGFFVAAIRECFEEAGLLFAGNQHGVISFEDLPTRERFEMHRNDLNARATTLAAICRAEGLSLAVDRFRYLSHWITPLGAPRRYDTRFFVATAPENQVALHDDGEVVASEWMEPSEAVQRYHAGELHLMFPTLKHLEALTRFSSAREFWASAPAEVRAVEARVTADGDNVRFLVPGDPGFDEATGLPDGMAFPDRPEAGGRG